MLRFALLILILTSKNAISADIPHSEIMRFAKIVNEAKRFAADPKPDEDIINGAINGAITSFDAHSEYIPAKHYNKIEEYIKGEFAGAGIYIGTEEGLIKAIGIIEGSPAEKYGVKVGDYITHIGDESTFKMNTEAASKKIRGKPGSHVELTIIRAGESKPITINIKRDIIRTEPVRAKYNDGILVLRISMFNAITADAIRQKLEHFTKHGGIKGLVIDLRNNPGGVLDGAIASAGFFVHNGAKIVSSQGFLNNITSTTACIIAKPCRYIRTSVTENKVSFFNASDPIIPQTTPIVVLINGASASASEILAAAIRENDRGTLVGEKTFGKGSVQTVMPIDRGNGGAMKITTSLYYTPNDVSIQAIGIMPDITIEQMEVKKRSEFKSFMPERESDLDNHIKNHITKEQKLNNEKNEIDPNDYQLSMALGILKSMIIKKL